MWSAKPKIFTIWFLQEKFAKLWNKILQRWLLNIEILKNMDELHEHNIEQKKPDIKENMFYYTRLKK